MATKNSINIGQGYILLPGGIKPLPEPGVKKSAFLQ